VLHKNAVRIIERMGGTVRRDTSRQRDPDDLGDRGFWLATLNGHDIRWFTTWYGDLYDYYLGDSTCTMFRSFTRMVRHCLRRTHRVCLHNFRFAVSLFYSKHLRPVAVLHVGSGKARQALFESADRETVQMHTAFLDTPGMDPLVILDYWQERCPELCEFLENTPKPQLA
jgi:hypothetical protein